MGRGSQNERNSREIAKLLIHTEAELQDLVLIEREGSRVIHMSIGLFEAAAIRRRLANEPASRPQTHDLLENTITALDARPHHVLIRHEDNGVFFADLVLERQGDQMVIDARLPMLWPCVANWICPSMPMP